MLFTKTKKKIPITKYVWPKDHNKYLPHQGKKETGKRMKKYCNCGAKGGHSAGTPFIDGSIFNKKTGLLNDLIICNDCGLEMRICGIIKTKE